MPVTRKSRKARGAKAGSPKRTAKSSSARSASAANASCYVTVSPLHVTVARSKPKAAPAVGPCICLEQARNAVMDALLERIEEAERKLTATKHVTTLDELRSL